MVKDYYVTMAADETGEEKRICYEIPTYTHDDAVEIAKDWYKEKFGIEGEVLKVKVAYDY